MAQLADILVKDCLSLKAREGNEIILAWRSPEAEVFSRSLFEKHPNTFTGHEDVYFPRGHGAQCVCTTDTTASSWKLEHGT